MHDYLWFGYCGAHNVLRMDMLAEEDRKIIFPEYGKKCLKTENDIIKNRFARQFDNNQRRIELLFALLFGSYNIPVIYYGDEIGMGDNTYLKNSIYTPMQWDDSTNAGFSDCIPSKLYAPVITDPEYHYSIVNVEVQKNKPNSIFNFIKKLLACRNKYKAFSRGIYVGWPLTKKEVKSFMRSYEDEMILVLSNLSGEIQHFDIDLSDYSGMYLLDIYNDATFPQISEIPCRVTLDPYGFYYLKLIDVEWPDDE